MTSLLNEALSLLDRSKAGDELAAHSLECLMRSYIPDGRENLFEGIHLSPIETRIAERIFAKPGKYVPIEHILNAMYFDATDEPGYRTIAVHICRIRQKLRGTRFSIPDQTRTRGHGYMGLIAEPSAAALTQLKAA